jgi:CDP-glucose 4,6-dehydratase
MNSLKNLFYKKKILVTGHTGFKGSWLSLWLHHLGAIVTGVALDPPSTPSHYKAASINDLVTDHRVDIRKFEDLQSVINNSEPDFVFHLAAQPLVKQSYIDPLETYETNILGTLNVLESLRTLKKTCVVVMITSDKCYENVEWIWGYRENDRLGGSDPYSASKGAAELVIRSFIKSFFPKNGLIRIGIGRAGNVIGGGDWAQNRVVPDCFRSWKKGNEVAIHNPNSTRPWQHVLEPLSGYLKLSSALSQGSELHGEPFNFGPPLHQNYTVKELVESLSKFLPETRWKVDSVSENSIKESGLLKLNCEKARHFLGWQSELSINDTLRMTAEWYRSYYETPSTIRKVTLAQIKEYETIANKRVFS